MPRLTKTGALYLLILVLFYVASVTSQSGLLLSLIGLLGGCYLLNWILASHAVRHLELEVPEHLHLVEGQSGNEPLRILNRSPRATGFITIRLGRQILATMERLPGGRQSHTLPKLIILKRGIYPHQHLQLSCEFPFGLIRSVRTIASQGEIVVAPLLYPASVPQAAAFESMVGGKFKGRHTLSSGTYFAGIRPWQSQDSFKQVHWKSSSKGQGLMVKTFEEELSGRLAIVVDSGRSDGREGLADDCVRAAGSVMFAALDEGHHLDWTDLTTQTVRLVPPFADGSELLNDLARITDRSTPLTSESILEASSSLSKKGALSIFLTEANPAVVEACAELLKSGRRVSLFLPKDVPLPEPIACPLWRFSSTECWKEEV